MRPTEHANAAQSAYWNETAGRTWAELNALLDRQLNGVGLKVIETLAPREGERVLDVGCGAGVTSLQIAERVGARGQVVGIDISGPLLDVARARAAGDGNVQLIEADAQTHPFEAETFDAVFSRFGVMFFEDPEAAFRNLARALRPGGRLAFACWRPLAENPLMAAPMQAAARRLAPPPPPPPPGAPGPFGFADPDRVRRVLGAAGFEAVAVEPLDLMIGGNSLDQSMTLALRVGPLGAVLRENPDVAPQVIDDVRAALTAHLRDGGVWMPGAMWQVTARRA